MLPARATYLGTRRAVRRCHGGLVLSDAPIPHETQPGTTEHAETRTVHSTYEQHSREHVGPAFWCREYTIVARQVSANAKLDSETATVR